jgi:DNA polymerase III sliding clamp (beta) subunit (PCNA family)
MNQTIELPVDELKTALTGLNKVVSKSSHLPVLQAVRVALSQSGEVTLQTTDLDSFLTYRTTEPQAGPATTVVVPLDALKQLVKTCPAQERLHLTRDEKDRVTLRYYIGLSPVEKSYEVPYGDDWPKEPPVIESASAVDDAFKRSLREALDCAGSESSRPVLNGAYVDIGRRSGSYLVGTDGRHLYCANSFTLDLKQSVIVPGRKFLLWPAFAEDGDWTLGLCPAAGKERAWVQVASARWTFLTKAIEGEYPDWRTVSPTRQEEFTHVVLDERGVAQLLESSPRLPVSDETNQAVMLEVREGKFWLKGRASEREAWTTVEIATASVQGKARCVRFNRLYLTKALRWGLNEIELRAPAIPLVFRQGGRRLVVAVMGEVPSAVTEPPGSPPPPSPVADSPSQPETTAATPPSVPPSENLTEERNPMPATQPSAPRHQPVQPVHGETEASPSALRAAVDHLETIRGTLRELAAQVNNAGGLLKAAEKESRTIAQETESVRRTLRSLQRVQL